MNTIAIVPAPNRNEHNFTFNGYEFKILWIEKKLWFIAKEVCDFLEIENVSQALNRLKENQKGIFSNDTAGGLQNMLIISESGFYKLVSTSRKPQAQPLQDFVCEEVLPSIRTTGSYVIKPKVESCLIDDRIERIQAYLEEQKETKEKFLSYENTIDLQAELISDLEPKGEFVDNLEATGTTILISELAKIISQKLNINLGGNKLFNWFRTNKILMSKGEIIEDFEYNCTHNFPYQKYRQYFYIQEHIIYSNNRKIATFAPKINVAGQEYFLNKIVKLHNQNKFTY